MFDLRLLCSLLLPKKTFWICLVCFLCLSYLYRQGQPELTPADLGGLVQDFLDSEQSNHPKYPKILIAGSSVSGQGFHIEELEKRTEVPAAKVSLGNGAPIDALGILECYLIECQSVKIVLLELPPQILQVAPSPMRKQFFDQVRGIKSAGTLAVFLKRSSLQYFIELYSKPLKRFVRLRSAKQASQYPLFERNWCDPNTEQRTANIRNGLRQYAEQARTIRKESTPENLPLMIGLKKVMEADCL